MISKLTFMIFAIIFLSSCEKNKYLSTENEFPLDVKKKIFTAKTIRNVYRNPSLLTTSRPMLGRYTFKDKDDRPIYRMYVRPVFSFLIDIDDTYRKATYDENDNITGYTGEFKFIEQQNFRFRVDSLLEDSRFNSGFNSQVKVKIIATDFFGENAFLKENTIFENSKHSELIDPANERIHEIGITDNAVMSESGNKSTYDIAIENDQIAKIFNRYPIDINGSVVDTFQLEGLALDYDFQSDGVITIDTIPQLTLKTYYEDEDHNQTDSVITSVLNPSRIYLWVTYERLIPENEELYTTRYGDRNVIEIGFNEAEIVDFLNSNKVFGAQIKIETITREEDKQDVFSNAILQTLYDNTGNSNYLDDLPLDSVLVTNGSGISLDNEITTNNRTFIQSQFKSNVFSVMNDAYINNWVNNRGEIGKILLTSGLSKIGITNFPKINIVDSNYQFIIYYTENIK